MDLEELQADLQFMLKEWDDRTMSAQAYPETFIAAFVKAARLVANPNIKAAAHAVARSLNLTYWAGTEEQAEVMCVDIATAAVAAAHTPGDTNDS